MLTPSSDTQSGSSIRQARSELSALEPQLKALELDPPQLRWLALDSPSGGWATPIRWSFARVISSHWTKNGTAQQRKDGLEKILPKRGEKLPLAFVLLQHQGTVAPLVLGGAVMRPLSAFATPEVTESASGLVGPACVMVTVIVDKASRGLGHGRRVVTHLESSARDLGFACMYLFSDDSVDFYSKLGYELVPGVKPRSGCPWMRKLLSAG